MSCLINHCFCFHKEVLKQVKEEKGSIKDKLGQVEGM